MIVVCIVYVEINSDYLEFLKGKIECEKKNGKN